MRAFLILSSAVHFLQFAACNLANEKVKRGRVVTFFDEKHDTPFSLNDVVAIINCFISEKSPLLEESNKPVEKEVRSYLKRIVKASTEFKNHSGVLASKDVRCVDKSNKAVFATLVQLFDKCISFMALNTIKSVEIDTYVSVPRNHPLYSLTVSISEFKRDFKTSNLDSSDIQLVKQKVYNIAYWIVTYLRTLDAQISRDYQLVLDFSD